MLALAGSDLKFQNNLISTPQSRPSFPSNSSRETHSSSRERHTAEKHAAEQHGAAGTC
jgi:hypothetical protein